DCSVQRRHQKVAEETPCPVLTPELRARMIQAAVRAGESVDYRGAGTVEFLLDPASLPRGGEFFFLEMNARLQVEHPITELVTGVDLVEQQLLAAAGEPASFDPDAVTPSGHAIEFRVYAEDPKRFFPSPGTIATWVEPSGPGVRVDAGYSQGNTVSQFYDPLMAKLCVHGPDRATALARARDAVAAFEVVGPKSNLPFFTELLDDPEFVSGVYDTGLIDRMRQPK
ncbi:MAG: biotin carboxylase, partial [Acidothermaceae bacterium]